MRTANERTVDFRRVRCRRFAGEREEEEEEEEAGQEETCKVRNTIRDGVGPPPSPPFRRLPLSCCRSHQRLVRFRSRSRLFSLARNRPDSSSFIFPSFVSPLLRKAARKVLEQVPGATWRLSKRIFLLPPSPLPPPSLPHPPNHPAQTDGRITPGRGGEDRGREDELGRKLAARIFNLRSSADENRVTKGKRPAAFPARFHVT